MKPILYEGCKLFYWDRRKLESGTIEPYRVGVRRLNGRVEYYLLSGNKDILIVQAMNFKKAAAKFLTMIKK